MAIRVFEDDQTEPGYAWIDLGRRIDSAAPRLSLRRTDADPRHLGLDRWQSEIAWLAVEQTRQTTSATQVMIGPVAVDVIDELVPIEIHVEDVGLLGTLGWPQLTPSPWKDGPRVVMERGGAKGKKGETGGVTGTGQSPPPKPPEPPGPTETGTQKVVEEPKVEPPKVQPPDPGAPANPAKKGMPKWLFLLPLLAAAGAALYFFEIDFNRSPPVPPAPPPPPVVRITAAEVTRQFDDMVRRRASAEEFAGLGKRALEAGHAPGAFRAFEEADPRSNEEAAWHMARFYDPSETAPAFRAAGAPPSAANAIAYYALWKTRSERHRNALRALCSAQSTLVQGNATLRAQCS